MNDGWTAGRPQFCSGGRRPQGFAQEVGVGVCLTRGDGIGCELGKCVNTTFGPCTLVVLYLQSDVASLCAGFAP